MIDPLNPKSYHLYMDMAIRASRESVATRRKVGCVVVTKTGMIGVGWNATPAGFDNCCEKVGVENGELDYLSLPHAIHAERNALDKLARQGVPAEGAIVFVTLLPCLQCAMTMHAVGVKTIFYLETKNTVDGLKYLKEAGVDCRKWEEEFTEEEILTIFHHQRAKREHYIYKGAEVYSDAPDVTIHGISPTCRGRIVKVLPTINQSPPTITDSPNELSALVDFGRLAPIWLRETKLQFMEDGKIVPKFFVERDGDTAQYKARDYCVQHGHDDVTSTAFDTSHEITRCKRCRRIKGLPVNVRELTYKSQE